ncbi:hypothetical protein D9758_011414 [Tetrapyrgos nigripes]|uniref:PPM-type phosphatase domain-containing protein n=1 Tax=Tetrapyrgos nigripes TaxID=182062 RepID=A0A8H5CR79_9AGAR|nr:hypothetical protein D9758_011414 [Tetrapyrgos nigripes]
MSVKVSDTMRNTPGEMGRLGGSDLWPYTILSEPTLSSELARLASAQIIDRRTHCVSFQPNGIPECWNQDRYVVKDIDVGFSSPHDARLTWRLRAVFDGHLGHELVNHAAAILPSTIQTALQEIEPLSKSENDPETISSLLQHCIISFDQSIFEDIMSFLPSAEDLTSSSVSDEDIRRIINDRRVERTDSLSNYAKIIRSMQGSTALIALISPNSEKLWIANLGDCQAGIRNPSSGSWDTLPLNTPHTGWEEGEADRILKEHPNEPDVILRGRVLGAMGITRALGDYHYKLASIYTDRVFLNMDPPGWLGTAQEDHEWTRSIMHRRNLTPPYLSNVPDVRYFDLRAHHSSGYSEGSGVARANGYEILSSARQDSNVESETFTRNACLVICSDGLMDLYKRHEKWEDLEEVHIFERWIELALVDETPAFCLNAEVVPKNNSDPRHSRNHALRILRDALGGEDEERVSSMITVEMEEKWMDDTTVIVELI